MVMNKTSMFYGPEKRPKIIKISLEWRATCRLHRNLSKEYFTLSCRTAIGPIFSGTVFRCLSVWRGHIAFPSKIIFVLFGRANRVESLPGLEEPVSEAPVGGPADQEEGQQGRVQEVEAQQDGAVPYGHVTAASHISCPK
jgi:hypothetical protein